MTPLPTRREHETHDLGPFTVRIGRRPDAESFVERVARELDEYALDIIPGHENCDECLEKRHLALTRARMLIADLGISWPPVVEVFFDQRGKVGTELNQFLHDAGVLISKVLQGKEVG